MAKRKAVGKQQARGDMDARASGNLTGGQASELEIVRALARQRQQLAVQGPRSALRESVPYNVCS